MKEFTYTIKDELGIHARPAGMLVKLIKTFNSSVKIEKGESSVDALRLIALMGLGIKQGDTITVKVDGDDEAASADAIKQFLTENL